MIDGSPSRFSIKLPKDINDDKLSPDDKLFIKLRNEGKLILDNLSSKTHSGLLKVSLSPGVRVNIDWLKNYLNKKATNRETYYIKLTDGEKVYLKGIREWIDITFNNYMNLLSKYKSDRVQKLNKDKEVYLALPSVVEYFLKNPEATNKQISDSIGIDEELVNRVLSKPISTLRKTDSEKEVKVIEDKLNEANSFNPNKFIEDVII
jgi:hypothetical protein